MFYNYVTVDKPAINKDQLPAIVPVFNGFPESLVCKADGNPKPTIKWLFDFTILSTNETVPVKDGIFNCTATNDIGTDYRKVQVITEGNINLLSFFLPPPNFLLIFIVEVVTSRKFFWCRL